MAAALLATAWPGSSIAPAAAAAATPSPSARAATSDPRTVHIFYGDMIHFLPDDSLKFDRPGVRSEQKGRIVVRTVDLGAPLRAGG